VRRKERKKKNTLEAYWSSNYDTTSIIGKISKRRIQRHQGRSIMVTEVGHSLYLKPSGKLQWGEMRDKKRKKKTPKAHWTFDYNTTGTIKKISMKWI